MISTLITSSDEALSIIHAKTICETQKISPFDIQVFEKEGKPTKKLPGIQSIGIDDILLWQKSLFLKPFHGKVKASIIPRAELLTTQAQNALLKVLEEPPQNTIIFLLTNDEEAILPTVRSRCKIIKLQEKQTHQPNVNDELALQLQTLRIDAPAMALMLAEKILKDKNEKQILISLLTILREDLLQENVTNKKYIINSIKYCQETLTLLKTTNINTRLALEHLFLNMQNNI